MSLTDEVMPVVDRFGDDCYREGYLRALADAEVLRENEPVPEGYESLLEQRLVDRRERNWSNHKTGAAA